MHRADIGKVLAALAAQIRIAHGLKTGEAYSAIEEKLSKTAHALALKSWELKQSPSSGKAWRPSKEKGRGDLFESGKLKGSVRVEDRPNGFAISIRAQTKGGQYYGGTHQYGRTIRPRGVKTTTVKTFGPDGSVTTKKLRGHYNTFGAKPLIGGRWKIRIPSRAMLPRAGQLPAAWDDAFRREIARWTARYFGSYYTLGSPDIRLG